jgi:hypothetical protein
MLVLAACSSSSSSSKTSLPPGSDPNADVKPPVTDVPDNAGDPPLAKFDLDCQLLKTDEMCSSAKAGTMSVTVNRVKQCSISNLSHELTLGLESIASPKDSVDISLNNFPSASGITGSYSTSKISAVSLTDGGGLTSGNGVSPYTGKNCQAACTVGVVESSPGGVRNLALDVRCPELCPSNGCVSCKIKGTPDVHFKLAVGCP